MPNGMASLPHDDLDSETGGERATRGVRQLGIRVSSSIVAGRAAHRKKPDTASVVHPTGQWREGMPRMRAAPWKLLPDRPMVDMLLLSESARRPLIGRVPLAVCGLGDGGRSW